MMPKKACPAAMRGGHNAPPLSNIFIDPVRHFAVFVERSHQGNLCRSNFSFVAALEGAKQPVFRVSQCCRDHVESRKVRLIFDAHDRRVSAEYLVSLPTRA